MKLLTYSGLTLGFSLLLLHGCAAQSDSTAEEEFALTSIESVREADRACLQAAHDHVIDDYLTNFLPTATVIEPDGTEANGTDAIRVHEGPFFTPAFDYSWTTEHVLVLDDVAHTSGVYTATYTDQNGQPVTLTGPYAVIWTKEHGAWKIAFDAGFSSAPPTAAASTEPNSHALVALRAADAAALEAARNHDVEAYLKHFLKGATVIEPDGTEATGLKAIRTHESPFFSPAFDYSWTTDHALVVGTVGFTSGVYTAKYTDQNGQLVTLTGPYAVGWHKVESGWKIAFDQGFSTAPSS